MFNNDNAISCVITKTIYSKFKKVSILGFFAQIFHSKLTSHSILNPFHNERFQNKYDKLCFKSNQNRKLKKYREISFNKRSSF